jgi:hypothetical protein
MKVAFDRAFHDMVGTAYGFGDVDTAEADLMTRPTLLIQLAGDAAANERIGRASQGGAVVGLAGALDPDHPHDVVVAVPASHYYEYDEERNAYVAGLYAGGDGEAGIGGRWNVIGANAMMGHDVHFDVERGRIGWSESSCDYSALIEPSHLKEGSESGDDSPVGTNKTRFAGTFSLTCKLGVIASFVVAGAVVVLILARRRGSDRRRLGRYSAAPQQELELTASDLDPPSSDNCEGQFRDCPSNARAPREAEERRGVVAS